MGSAFGVSPEGHHPIVHLTEAQCQKVEHVVLVEPPRFAVTLFG